MNLRHAILILLALTVTLPAQKAPYDNPPEVKPPYYRVRFEASAKPGELIFPVQYTVWIPAGVKQLRGVVVHQHGCGEGSCKSGQTGAFDLHWQALAKKHDCALLAPSYEQPQKADCQMWCDPRNGSSKAFQEALVELGKLSGHAELATVPWALWGHSGGGHWAGGMVMLHPERVAAAWLRSGVPFLAANPDRPTIKPHTLPKAALGVPMMCNPGTKEGVTVKTGRFARVWPMNETFLRPSAVEAVCSAWRLIPIRPRMRQPTLPRHPVARHLPHRASARPVRSTAQAHAHAGRLARSVTRRHGRARCGVYWRQPQRHLAAQQGHCPKMDAVRNGHQGDRYHPAACTQGREVDRPHADLDR